MRFKCVATIAAGAVLAIGSVQPSAAGGLFSDLPFLKPPPFEPDWSGVHIGSQAGYSFGAELISGVDVDGDMAFGGPRDVAGSCDDADRSSDDGPAPTPLGWLPDASSGCAFEALSGLPRITRFAPATDAPRADAAKDLEAVEAGLFVGADAQFGKLVVGILADVNAIGFDPGLSGSESVLSSDEDTSRPVELDWYASLRARLGFAVDRFLGYAHAGMIYAHTEPAPSRLRPADEELFGYTLGGGVEAMLTPKASARLEYQYADVNAADLGDLLSGGGSASSDIDFQTVRLGLALRF